MPYSLRGILRNVGKDPRHKNLKKRKEEGGGRKPSGNPCLGKFIRKEQLFCLVTALLFAVGSCISDGGDGFLKDGNKIERGAYGDIDREYELTVKGLSEKEEQLTVTVGARQYSEEEALSLYESLAESIPEMIRGNNKNLSEVRENLNLPKTLTEYGIKLTWYPEDAELISYDGEIRNESLKEDRETFLKLVFSDGNTSSAFDFPVTVKPKIMGEEEALLEGFKNLLSEENINQITGGELVLPTEFKGRRLEYKKEFNTNPVIIIALGLIAAVSLSFKEKTDELARLKRREEELLLDYSEVVSKLMVFLGAGFGIRGAWEKTVEGYEKALRAGGEKRVVYEEMRESLFELQRGVPEGKVYTDFGRRCRLRPYIKLCSLLEQNRKNGGKNIRALLSAEMAEAFLERKNIAKRLGEEAGTKLLVPLFIMLMIVMAIVILPAMLALN